MWLETRILYRCGGSEGCDDFRYLQPRCMTNKVVIESEKGSRISYGTDWLVEFRAERYNIVTSVRIKNND